MAIFPQLISSIWFYSRSLGSLDSFLATKVVSGVASLSWRGLKLGIIWLLPQCVCHHCPSILRGPNTCCQRTGKWKAVPYIQAFIYLCSNPSMCSSCFPTLLLAMKPTQPLPDDTTMLDPANKPPPFRCRPVSAPLKPKLLPQFLLLRPQSLLAQPLHMLFLLLCQLQVT